MGSSLNVSELHTNKQTSHSGIDMENVGKERRNDHSTNNYHEKEKKDDKQMEKDGNISIN